MYISRRLHWWQVWILLFFRFRFSQFYLNYVELVFPVLCVCFCAISPLRHWQVSSNRCVPYINDNYVRLQKHQGENWIFHPCLALLIFYRFSREDLNLYYSDCWSVSISSGRQTKQLNQIQSNELSANLRMKDYSNICEFFLWRNWMMPFWKTQRRAMKKPSATTQFVSASVWSS